jgi:hypothetical protein
MYETNYGDVADETCFNCGALIGAFEGECDCGVETEVGR